MSPRTECKLLEIQGPFHLGIIGIEVEEWETKNPAVEERSNTMGQQQKTNERKHRSWPWKAYLRKLK